jgi:hypothetical protein
VGFESKRDGSTKRSIREFLSKQKRQKLFQMSVAMVNGLEGEGTSRNNNQ